MRGYEPGFRSRLRALREAAASGCGVNPGDPGSQCSTGPDCHRRSPSHVPEVPQIISRGQQVLRILRDTLAGHRALANNPSGALATARSSAPTGRAAGTTAATSSASAASAGGSARTSTAASAAGCTAPTAAARSGATGSYSARSTAARAATGPTTATSAGGQAACPRAPTHSRSVPGGHGRFFGLACRAAH